MKKIFFLAFVLLASGVVFAQEKTIQQAEFETISKSSAKMLFEKPHRITRTQQSTVEILQPENGAKSSVSASPASSISVKSITEFLPSVGFRTVYEFNSSSKNTKKEMIRIGGKTYTRENDAGWAELSVAQTASRARSANSNADHKIEYKAVGTEKLNNQNANIYAKIETARFVNPADNKENVSSTTTKYWYAEDGRLLKRERRREIRNGKMVSRFVSTTVFETDPSIKIEAPKLN
jgi:hypothetical protein